MRILVATLLAFASTSSLAQSFSGEWKVDFRSQDQRSKQVECGSASFNLTQQDAKIRGTFSAGTPNCGRMDDGGQVRGMVTSPKSAVLIVQSARDNSISIGSASISPEGFLSWETSDHLFEQGDNLIPVRATFRRIP